MQHPECTKSHRNRALGRRQLTIDQAMILNAHCLICSSFSRCVSCRNSGKGNTSRSSARSNIILVPNISRRTERKSSRVGIRLSDAQTVAIRCAL